MPFPTPTAITNMLAARPVSTVTAVVGPLGPGGSKGPGRGPWTMTVGLTAWRDGDGPVIAEPVTLRKMVGDDELNDLQRALPADSVVRFRARVGPPADPGGPPRQALLEEALGPADDADLAALLAESKKPVTRDDPRFGPLTLDRRFGTWEAETTWAGDPVTLTLETDERDGGEDYAAALRNAHTLWADEAAWAGRVVACVVDHCLDSKNDNWLGDDEEPLTEAQFVDRLAIDTVTAAPDGGLGFWFDDGDLFWGHSIMVEATLEGGPTDAGIHG